MNYAYDELYLPLAQRILGDMYDYAVGTLGYALKEFHKLFLVSPISKQFEIGNPTYVAGKNGCEVAREVIQICTGEEIEHEDLMYMDKSPEYWIGWSLGYYQWLRNVSFHEIEQVCPADEMYGMYGPLHEADISLFVNIVDERFKEKLQNNQLKRLRMYAGLSQSALARQANVPLRQIQLFEQGQRDIKKAQVQTVKQLAQALKCDLNNLI